MILLQNIGWFLFLIGVMILVHEAGHYLAARYFDVYIEAFSFGFGPRLFGFRRGETDFRVCAIPFGGYVKMAGEQPTDEQANDPRSFLNKARWQRLIIAFAGPFMNIVLAIVLLTGLYMWHYPKPINADAPATIGYIAPNSPAAQAGLQEGDIIVAVDGKAHPTWEQVWLREVADADKTITVVVRRNGQESSHTFAPSLDEKTGLSHTGWADQSEMRIEGVLAGMDADKAGLKPGDQLVTVNGQVIRSIERLQEVLKAGNGQPVNVVYSREGQNHAVSITPVFKKEDNRWLLGVQIKSAVELVQLSFPDALRESLRHNGDNAYLIFGFLKDIVAQRMSPKRLEGPIRIAKVSGDAARAGSMAFIELMAMVSMNLAIFNLLPIPILDGGVILLLLIEMIMRRDLSMPVKETVFKLGFAFLMMIVVFVLYNDITKTF